MNASREFDRACGHPGYGGGCRVCWAENFVQFQSEATRHYREVCEIVERMEGDGLNADLGEQIRLHVTPDDLVHIRYAGHLEIRALNDAWGSR